MIDSKLVVFHSDLTSCSRNCHLLLYFCNMNWSELLLVNPIEVNVILLEFDKKDKPCQKNTTDERIISSEKYLISLKLYIFL